MTTTTFNHTRFNGHDRLAGPSIATKLVRALRAAFTSPTRLDLITDAHAGERWCDSTERRINDEMMGIHRRYY